MSYVNSLVDKVFVINLDKDKERLEKINKSLTGQNISYERIPGVLGSKVGSSPHLSSLCNWFCTDGIKGCALSHHTAWKYMIERGYSRILILEDDAIIPDNFDEKVRHIMGRLPDDYEMVFLGCRYFCRNQNLTEQVGHKVMGTAPEQFTEEIVRVNGSLGSHAILYTRSAVEKFVNESITTHIDVQLQNWIRAKNIRAYGVSPEIVETEPNHTNGSNLADKFPSLTNAFFDQFEITNNTPLGWSLSENFMKIGPYNVNFYILFLFLFALILPSWLSPFLFAWILIEVAASYDVKNGIRYSVFLLTAIALRYSFENMNKLVRRLTRLTKPKAK